MTLIYSLLQGHNPRRHWKWKAQRNPQKNITARENPITIEHTP